MSTEVSGPARRGGGVQWRDTAVPTRHGEVTVRLWTPDSGIPSEPVVVWLHGSAYIRGAINMPEAMSVAGHLSRRGCTVAVVDYSLAEHIPAGDEWPWPPREAAGIRFPVPIDEVVDVCAALPSLAGVTSVWYLGGASAGASVALSAAQRLRDEGGQLPAGIPLVYPTAHSVLPPMTPELRNKYLRIPFEQRYSPLRVHLMNLNFVGTEDRMEEPYAFPGDGDLSGLPPVYVLNSELDGLRASGQTLAASLAAAGNDVVQFCEPEALHGHLNTPELVVSDRSLARIDAWMTLIEANARASGLGM
ncbi:alpha/beta hydrolase [Actinomyces sp. Z3]|nr:alpha/beta hydrolase [Actinomyces sp. Z3]